MKNYLLSLAILLSGCLGFTSCLNDNDSDPGKGPKEFTVTTGVFILNEGSYYNKINGSLSYIGYTRNFDNDEIYNGVFESRNKRSLGGTPNDLIANPNKAEVYIACCDENRVEITNHNLKSVGEVKVPSPRRLALDSNHLYVTSFDGCVYAVNLDTRKVDIKSEKIGANLEGIAFRNGSLYVCNSYNPADYSYFTEVIKLKASDLTKTNVLKVTANPVKIKQSGNELYVLSMGNYGDVKAEIQTIDINDNVTSVCNGTNFDVYNNNMVVANTITDPKTYKSTIEFYFVNYKGEKTTFKPSIDIKQPAAIAIDPNTGYLYISSYNLSAAGTADYAAPGYVCRFDLTTNRAKRFDAGVGPTNFLFTETKYIAQ